MRQLKQMLLTFTLKVKMKVKVILSYSGLSNTNAGMIKLFPLVFPPVRGLFRAARLLFSK